jgi:hypothetical protein
MEYHSPETIQLTRFSRSVHAKGWSVQILKYQSPDISVQSATWNLS